VGKRQDIAAGWYSLFVNVESLKGGVVYATDHITLPIQVGP
jgi:hypothetical protein